MKHTIVELPKSTLLKTLEKIVNGRFVSKAVPLRVDFFNHDLQNSSEANNVAATTLSKIPSETLHTFSEGSLNLYADAIVLITTDPQFPVKFYCAWKTILFDGKSTIQTQHIWADPKIRQLRLDGLSLGAYCVFKVLIPKYKIVVGSDEHTPDGERHAKKLVKYAIDTGIYVYVIDESNTLYNITTNEFVEKNTNVLWGVSPENRKRLIIYSEAALF